MFAATAHGQSPRETPGVPLHRVFIPVDDDRRPTGDRYYVPEPFFIRLYRRAAAATPAPQGAILSAATYRGTLAKDAAFQRAEASWKKDLPADASTVTFYRLDRWVEVRYELLRMGKKISSLKSLSGMLNGFFGGEPIEEGKPELDGSKLPPFNQVRKYFGTFEAAVVTVEKGWLMSGHVRR